MRGAFAYVQDLAARISSCFARVVQVADTRWVRERRIAMGVRSPAGGTHKVLLCAAVLFWGTVYTIARKAQFVMRVVGSDGATRSHHHAMFHTLFMFFGVACLLPIDASWRRADPSAPPLPRFSPLLMVLPAMCDVCCTAVDSLGLMKTDVSVYQMLRSLAHIHR